MGGGSEILPNAIQPKGRQILSSGLVDAPGTQPALNEKTGAGRMRGRQPGLQRDGDTEDTSSAEVEAGGGRGRGGENVFVTIRRHRYPHHALFSA